jgi:hypothetical protein
VTERKGARELLVPQVAYRHYDQMDIELSDRVAAAVRRGDYRSAAELKLEEAHRDMLRRDGSLAELVAAVERGDGEVVQNRAREYAAWSRFMDRDIETAQEWASRTSAVSEPER